MRRSLRITAWTTGVLLVVPALASTAATLSLDSGIGRTLAEQAIERATGGAVSVRGIGGRFPDQLRLDHAEVRDADGAWLIADGITLDWHPTALVRGLAQIAVLDIDRVQVPRLPVSAPPSATPSAPGKPFSLPVRVQADRVHVARAEIGAPVLGTDAVLSLEGRALLPSLQEPVAHLALHRLDGGGDYTVDADVTPEHIQATLAVAEPAGGLIATVAKLPDLGPLLLQAAVDGPRTALATTATLGAGPLAAAVKGSVDLDGQSLDLAVDVSAPSMRPAPTLSWESIALQAQVQGPFSKPDATGHLQLAGLDAGGAGLRQLTADLAGNAGQVRLHAVAEGLRVPGPDTQALAGSPLLLDATARLDDPARPVSFRITHPLLAAQGEAKTAGVPEVTAKVTLARLAPFAAIGGIDLQGSTDLTLHAKLQDTVTSVDATGTLSVTGGLAPLPGLIGTEAPVALAAELRGADLSIEHLNLSGRTLQLAVKGGRSNGVLDADIDAALGDLSVVAPTLSGAVRLQTRVNGPLDALALAGRLEGEVAAPGVKRGRVTADIALAGLPGAPSGTISAQGELAGAPLALAVHARRGADGALEATIDRADWRSLHADGALRLPAGATLPLGKVALRFGQLGDLSPFVGQALTGAVQATVELDPKALRLQAEASNAGVRGSRVGRATIAAAVADPLTAPVVTASANLQGIDAAGVTGAARIDVAGPQTALAIKASGGLNVSGTPAQIATAATLDVPGKRVRVATLQVQAKGETARLLAPATVGFADGVAVDRLRVGLREAVLDVAGRLSPRLDATVTLRAPAALAALAAPSLALDGNVALDASLTGTPAAPGGSVRLNATGLRVRSGPGAAAPPANVTATAQLEGGAARIDARVTAGSARLAVNGRAPLGAGPLDLHATGGLELALLDPILTAGGRRARGRLTLDASIAGTTASPRVGGTAQLAGGELQDFTQGVRIANVAATARAEGDTVRLVSLTGKAGSGTIAASGSVGVLAPGLPVDLAITARNARPITSDQLQIDLDADLTLRGQAAALMRLGGRVLIRHAEIRIPENLPPTVAALRVIRPGEAAAAPVRAGPTPGVDLELQVDAPRAVFVRGRGVDAEMAGDLRIRGSASKPAVSGGFDMRRGTLSEAGTTLTFSRGKVGFDGTGVNGKIDPTLDFIAESTSNGVTATLAITGYASAPKIKLSSVPDLPQDEVLAYLLFRRSVKDLGPFQIAEIAAALADLTGVGGSGGFNPLERVRSGLGLDRLSVGGASTGTGATVEAGRYVANGVYLGAKQGTSGSGTGATLQIDITKGLKLETDVGSGTGGNQVGVTYQFEY